MPLGIVSDEEFNGELNRYNDDVVVKDNSEKKVNEKVIDINRGRGIDRKEVPESIRKMIAEESICGAPAKSIMETLGVSQSSISAYKNGATSTSRMDKPDSDLKNHVEKVKEEITSTARGRLMAALMALDDEKIGAAKARDIAGIAKDMSGVMKNMEPTGPLVQNNQQVIVYRPRVKEEEDYDIITVNE